MQGKNTTKGRALDLAGTDSGHLERKEREGNKRKILFSESEKRCLFWRCEI